jgi:ribonuclease-3 family protein
VEARECIGDAGAENINLLSPFAPRSDDEARLYSPVTLAYVGDAVYEVLVRDYLTHERSVPTNILNKTARRFVSASAQSRIFDEICKTLTDEEMYYYRRGRNTKASTVPKNADVIEYRKATGVEAVFGYLYITGRIGRIKEIFCEIIKLGL